MTSLLQPDERTKILDVAFGSDDVEQVLLSVVHFLKDHPTYLDPFDHRSLEVYDFPAYRDAWTFVNPLFGSAASATNRTPVRLGAPLRAILRNRFEELLAGGPRSNVFPVLLALIKGIDLRFSPLLLRDFRLGRSLRSAHAMPVEPGRVLPKPWAAFQTAHVEEESRPPTMRLHMVMLLLERYLFALAFPVHPKPTPQPALHVRSMVCPDPNKDEWRIATLSIFTTVWDVDWQEDELRFWGCDLTRSEAVVTRLRWALEQCRLEKVDIIVLPELNVNAEMELELRRAVRPVEGEHSPQLIVCGALHEVEDAEIGTYRNRPRIFTPTGPLEWDYWKIEPTVEELPKGIKTEALGDPPPHVLAIDLPIGRVALAVCKDFLDAEFQAALEQMRTNVLILVSMTGAEAVRAFFQRAREMASSSWMVTVYCNSSIHHRAPLYKDGHQRVLGFLHPNTRIAYDEVPVYELPDESMQSVIGIYTLKSDDELKVQLETLVYPPRPSNLNTGLVTEEPNPDA